MKHLHYFTLLGFLFLLYSCKPSDSGSYVVYDVSTYDQHLSENGLGEYAPNDTINTYLKNKMMGTKLNLTFTNEYVKITIPGSADELYLNNIRGKGHKAIYLYDHETPSKVWSYVLYKKDDDNVVFEVALRMEKTPLVMPVQLGGGR